MRLSICAILGVALMSAWSKRALAGNLDGYFIGNVGALTAGAVTAGTRDAEALWYNPAGLAGLGDGRRRNTLDVGATAFMLKFRPMPGALETDLNGDIVTRSLDEISFDTVPTSLLYVRELSPTLGLGFGLVVPVKDQMSVEDAFTKDIAAPGLAADLRFEQRGQFTSSRVEYHAGIGIGWAPTDSLRVGLSFFVTYAVMKATGSFWAHLYAPEQEGYYDATILVEVYDEVSAIGGHVSAGVQWDVGAGVTLGLQIRTPGFVFATFPDGNLLAVASQTSTEPAFDAGASSAFDAEARTESGFDLLRGLRCAAGVSWAFESGFIGAEFDLQLANDNDLDIETEFVWNARVGVLGELSERWSIGAGFFTDQSANAYPDAIGELDVSYYGAVLGAELRTVYPLSPEAGQEAKALVVATTIGLRYAYGSGQVGALRYFPFAQEGEETVLEGAVPVTFHEVSLHLGSSFSF